MATMGKKLALDSPQLCLTHAACIFYVQCCSLPGNHAQLDDYQPFPL